MRGGGSKLSRVVCVPRLVVSSRSFRGEGAEAEQSIPRDSFCDAGDVEDGASYGLLLLPCAC